MLIQEQVLLHCYGKNGKPLMAAALSLHQAFSLRYVAFPQRYVALSLTTHVRKRIIVRTLTAFTLYRTAHETLISQ